MIEHGNSHVAEWSKLISSLIHLTEFMNPWLCQMIDKYFLIPNCEAATGSYINGS